MVKSKDQTELPKDPIAQDWPKGQVKAIEGPITIDCLFREPEIQQSLEEPFQLNKGLVTQEQTKDGKNSKKQVQPETSHPKKRKKYNPKVTHHHRVIILMTRQI